MCCHGRTSAPGDGYDFFELVHLMPRVDDRQRYDGQDHVDLAQRLAKLAVRHRAVHRSHLLFQDVQAVGLQMQEEHLTTTSAIAGTDMAGQWSRLTNVPC